MSPRRESPLAVLAGVIELGLLFIALFLLAGMAG